MYLTHFWLVFLFYTSCNHRKTEVFPVITWDIKKGKLARNGLKSLNTLDVMNEFKVNNNDTRETSQYL